jgi:Tol biopolymer transport system component
MNAVGQITGAVALPPGHYESLRIAPDGKRAVMVKSTSSAESQLWLVDLARGGAVPLSTGPGRHDDPVWSPDGTQIVFGGNAEGPMNFFIRTVDDTSPPRLLYRSDVLFKNPVGWSPDGRWVVVNQVDPGTSQDIWLLPMPDAGSLTPFVRSPGVDGLGMPSPDNRWIQYISNETGQMQLYVQSFPEPRQRIQVSRDGASRAGWWSHDGRQILFADIAFQALWAVEVQPGVGTPRKVATLPPNVVFMDAMPDRQSFIAIVPERAGTSSMTVVRNWRAALDGKGEK